MDVATARALLGVAPSAGPAELRAAYRAKLRSTHPDLNRGGDTGTAAVVDAYRVLRGDAPHEPAAAPPAPAPTPTATPVPVSVGVVVEGDTVVADLPAGDLFALLLDAAETLGEVAYVDGHAGLLEVVVEVAGYGACSVVLTLQGRAAGHTEAWCTVEPLGGGPAPPVEAIAELLANGLRAITQS